MTDRCLRFAGTAPGRFLTRGLGLPRPAPPRRRSPQHPALAGGPLHPTAGKSASVLRTTDALLGAGAVRRGGWIVATASIAGRAGNAGQTNHGAGEAGVVGLVRSLAPRALAEHGVTVNAVAPGFIETTMTAAIPLFIREAGRRMNSLARGGLPADVAQSIAWRARPASGAVNGQVVRVCGQSLLGA